MGGPEPARSIKSVAVRGTEREENRGSGKGTHSASSLASSASSASSVAASACRATLRASTAFNSAIEWSSAFLICAYSDHGGREEGGMRGQREQSVRRRRSCLCSKTSSSDGENFLTDLCDLLLQPFPRRCILPLPLVLLSPLEKLLLEPDEAVAFLLCIVEFSMHELEEDVCAVGTEGVVD